MFIFDQVKISSFIEVSQSVDRFVPLVRTPLWCMYRIQSPTSFIFSFIFILQTQRGFVDLALQSSGVPLLTRYKNHLGTSDKTAHLEGLFTFLLRVGNKTKHGAFGCLGRGSRTSCKIEQYRARKIIIFHR